MARRAPNLGLVTRLVYGYVGLTAATLVALAVLSVLAPQQATAEAWGHQVIVAIFAVVLPLRVRAARRGSDRALRAVTIIALVVAVVNLVEAFLPAFPLWMRVVMVAVVLLMAALAGVATGRLAARTTS
ncbi:hypothetical protein GCM10027613_44620 [Microlunatus endophyticus]